MSTSDKPIGIALIICDRVITEAGTNEKTLVGTFNQISAPSCPCVHPRLSVFISVTNGRGQTEATLRCVNEAEPGKSIFGRQGVIPFSDPNQVVEIDFEFINVTFLQPGLHAIEFLCDGELILQSRFIVQSGS